MNQCIWAWAVLPKLTYHNKWFYENVLANMRFLPYEKWLPICMIEWRGWTSDGSLRGSSPESGHPWCSTLILGPAWDIQGMQFGEKPFLIAVNGL